MGTSALLRTIQELRRIGTEEQAGVAVEALGELKAFERAAQDLTRLHLGDGVYEVRSRHKVMTETPDGSSTWEHPDVKAWSDAAVLLAAIAKEAQ